MDAKTTKLVGAVVGSIVGIFFGTYWGKTAEHATTEIIDEVDKDDDDVNKQELKDE